MYEQIVIILRKNSTNSIVLFRWLLIDSVTAKKSKKKRKRTNESNYLKIVIHFNMRYRYCRRVHDWF